MSKFGFVTGCALIALGAVVGVYGSPYYMLDWGGTLVVSGLVMAACGFVLLMLAAVLRQLQIIAQRLEVSAAVPLAARADPPLEAAAPVQEAAPPTASDPIPAPTTVPSIPTVAIAAGAAVAAGGLATAAANILSSVSSTGDRSADPAEPEPPAPIRDDLFGKVEEAVRALKDEAGATAPAVEMAAAQEDLDSLRADLLADAPPPADADEPAPNEEAVEPPPAAEPDGATVPEADRSAPAASEEGVVAAYTVGDSSYTMFADGRIRADTPDGELRFSNMDELKEHMAKRRLGG